MQISNFFPLNDSLHDPNARTAVPIGLSIHKDILFGTLVAGAKTVTVKAPFGKNLGAIYGALLLNNSGGAAVTAFTPDLNPIVSITAVAGTNEGEVDVTIATSDATATTASVVNTFILIGQIFPKSA